MLRSLIRKSIFLILLYFFIILLSFGIGFKLSAMNKRLIYYRHVMDDLELIASISTDQEKTKTEILTEFKTADIRIANLKYFFRKNERSSPLYP